MTREELQRLLAQLRQACEDGKANEAWTSAVSYEGFPLEQWALGHGPRH